MKRKQEIKTTEAVDMATSARSFAEKDLVSLRDDAIEVKEEQIRILNLSNEGLEKNIEHLEDEMEVLQAAIEHKNEIILALEARNSKLEDKVTDLERKLEMKKGRDSAIDVATAQNTQLLQMLQEQEQNTLELQLKHAELEEDLEEAKKSSSSFLTEKSELETQLMTESAGARMLRKELTSLRSKTEADEKLLRRKLERLQTESAQIVESLRDEVREKRERYFEMFGKLQIAEDKARGAEDIVAEKERTVEEMREQQLQSDIRLEEMRKWADSQILKHRNEVSNLQQEIKELKDHVKTEGEQKTKMKAELLEMSTGIVKSIEQHERAVNEVSLLKDNLSERRIEIDKLNYEQKLEKKALEKEIKRLELEKDELAKEIKSIQKRSTKAVQRRDESLNEHQDRLENLFLRNERLEKGLKMAVLAQQSRLDRLVELPGDHLVHRPKGSTAGFVIDFKKCYLANCGSAVSEEIAFIAIGKVLRKIASILEECCLTQDHDVLIELSRNGFRDVHAQQELANFVRTKFLASSVCLDLSFNHFTDDGISALVLNLQKNPRVGNVFVNQDGSIHGLRGSTVVFHVKLDGNLPIKPDSFHSSTTSQ